MKKHGRYNDNNNNHSKMALGKTNNENGRHEMGSRNNVIRREIMEKPNLRRIAQYTGANVQHFMSAMIA